MGRAFWFFVDPVKELHQQKIREKGDLTIEVSSVILRYAILANRHVSIIKYPPPCGEDVWSKEKIWFSKTHGTRLGGFQLICCHHWSFNNLSTKTQNHKCIGTSRFFSPGRVVKTVAIPWALGKNSHLAAISVTRTHRWEFGDLLPEKGDESLVTNFSSLGLFCNFFGTKNKQKSILFFSTRW